MLNASTILSCEASTQNTASVNTLKTYTSSCKINISMKWQAQGILKSRCYSPSGYVKITQADLLTETPLKVRRGSIATFLISFVMTLSTYFAYTQTSWLKPSLPCIPLMMRGFLKSRTSGKVLGARHLWKFPCISLYIVLHSLSNKRCQRSGT